MSRRKFISLLGGAAVAWPLVARAQQPERMRRIGGLTPAAASDLDGQARIAAFRQRLQQLGWTDGSNVRIEVRWSAGNVDEIRTLDGIPKEIVQLDVVRFVNDLSACGIPGRIEVFGGLYDRPQSSSASRFTAEQPGFPPHLPGCVPGALESGSKADAGAQPLARCQSAS